MAISWDVPPAGRTPARRGKWSGRGESYEERLERITSARRESNRDTALRVCVQVMETIAGPNATRPTWAFIAGQQVHTYVRTAADARRACELMHRAFDLFCRMPWYRLDAALQQIEATAPPRRPEPAARHTAPERAMIRAQRRRELATDDPERPAGKHDPTRPHF